MSKKLLIYGLAFGSATAALSYIYMVSIATTNNIPQLVIAILSEAIVIPAIAIFLFLRSVKKEQPEQFMLGRAIFLGFFLSIIIGASVSLLYSYVAQFRPEVIGRMVDYKINQFKGAEVFKQFNAKEAADKIQEIRDSYSVTGQFVFQLFFAAARGLFLSAIIAFFMRGRVVSSQNDVLNEK